MATTEVKRPIKATAKAITSSVFII
jgi:hypothetical protein